MPREFFASIPTSTRSIAYLSISAVLFVVGPALAECQFTPQNSVAIIGKTAYSPYGSFGVSVQEEELIAKGNTAEGTKVSAEYLKAMLETFVGKTRKASLLGIIDISEFSTGARSAEVTSNGIKLFGYRHDIEFRFDVVPPLRRMEEVSGDYAVIIEAKATQVDRSKEACSRSKTECVAYAQGNVTNFSADRAHRTGSVLHPADMTAKILSSPSERTFDYKIHVRPAQSLLVDGCHLSYSQVDMVEGSDTHHQESRFVLWGWLASARTEAELKGVSLAGKANYLVRNLLR